MKRIKTTVAILLVLIISLGILPLTSFAETLISSAGASVEMLKPNYSLPTSAVAEGSDYTCNLLGWYIGVDEVGNGFLESNHKVKEYEHYVVAVEFIPQSGKAFAFADNPSNANVKISGKKAYYCGKGSTAGSLIYRATIEQVKLIDCDYIYMEAPVVGKKVSCDFEIIYGSYYSNIDVYWYESDEMEYNMPFGATVCSSKDNRNYTFKADKYYTVLFNLKAKDGCFIENYYITVNNNEAGVKEENTYAQIWYCFGKPTETKQVYNLDTYIDYPIVGEKITDATKVLNSDPGYSCKVLGWYEGNNENTEGTFITGSKVFEKNKKYVVTVEFTMNSGYTYVNASNPDERYAFINDIGAVYCGKGTSPNSYRYRMSTVACTELSSVAFTGITPPSVGQKLSFFHKAPVGVSYSNLWWVELDRVPTSYKDIENASWMNQTSQWSADYTFKADKYYAAVLCVSSEWSYVFSNTAVTLNVNNSTFYDTEATPYDTNHYCYFYFGKPSTTRVIASLDITDIAIPFVGQKSGNSFSVTNSDLVKSKKLMWVEMDNAPSSYSDVDKVINGNGGQNSVTFKAGKNYVAVAVMSIPKENIVSEPWATVNGEKAPFVKYNDETLYVYYDFGKVQQPVSSFAATGITQPEIGKKASFTVNVTNSEHMCEKSLGWIKMDHAPTSVADIWDNGFTYYASSYDNDLTFKEGEYYVAVVVTFLNDGYAFSNVTATVNGKAPTYIYYNNGYDICYTYYSFGKLTSGNQINEPIPKYNLKTSVKGGHGSVTPSESDVEEGTKYQIFFYPDNGYTIDTVTINGTKVSIENNYVWVRIEQNVDVVVTFARVTVDVTEIFLNKTYIVLQPGEKDCLVPTVYPINATDKNVVFSSSDTSVATVDANGNITAISRGEAKISVIATGGIENQCTVSVFAVEDIIPKYDLATSVEGGGGRISEGLTGVDGNTTVTVLFIPDNGYEVDKVTLNGEEISVSTNYINVVMEKTTFVVVSFKKIAESNTDAVTNEPDHPITEPIATETTVTEPAVTTEPSASETLVPKPQVIRNNSAQLIILTVSAVAIACISAGTTIIIMKKKGK